jgi:hypothetical protein
MAEMCKSYYVSGNSGRTLAVFFIDNLAAHAALLKRRPLIIETETEPLFPDIERRRSRDKSPKDRGAPAETALPIISLARLRADGEAYTGPTDSISDVFCYGAIDPASVDTLEAFDYPLLLVKRDPYASGFVYGALKLLDERKIFKKIGIVITGTDLIEEAALTFTTVRAEMLKMTGQAHDLIFLGYFQPDIPRIANARGRGLAAVQLFPDSPFHGLVKFIYENLSALETYMKPDTVFQRLAATG